MTHDEINALPVDRLIAEVAVQVMGWKREEECNGNRGKRVVIQDGGNSIVMCADGDWLPDEWIPDKWWPDVAIVHARIREMGKRLKFIEELERMPRILRNQFELVTLSPLDHLRAALMAVQELSEA